MNLLTAPLPNCWSFEHGWRRLVGQGGKPYAAEVRRVSGEAPDETQAGRQRDPENRQPGGAPPLFRRRRSQRRAAPSSLPVSSFVPSGEKARAVMGRVWPCNSQRGSPVWASINLAVAQAEIGALD